MPRAKRVPSTPGRQAFESMWAQVAGAPLDYTLTDWDPDTAKLVQAILEVLATGSAVFIRPGGGGTTMGIAIWEANEKHPATWFTEHEEVDAWAARVIAMAEGRRAANKE